MSRKRKNTRVTWLMSLVALLVVAGMVCANTAKTQKQSSRQSQPTAISQKRVKPAADAVGFARVEGSQKEQLIQHMAYTVSYNPEWLDPNWVGYLMTRKYTYGEVSRCSGFSPDPDVKGYAVVHKDYSNSGYDRGHMVPAGDMKWSEQAMQETFYTTNICPQNQNLNRGDWKDIEEMVRDLAVKYDSIYVVCGPIMSKKPQRLTSGIAVPDAFFKALLRRDKSGWHAIGFVLPNEAGSKPIMTYMQPIDAIEQMANIDLFYTLPKQVQQRIESEVEPQYWTVGR